MTLYLSDLDGTLIDQSLTINPTSAQLLSKAIQRGSLFSIATARSAATAVQIIQNIPIQIPIILMNGAMIFDCKQEHYIHRNVIAKESVRYILDACHELHHTGFMFCHKDDMLYVYHDELQTPDEKDFYRNRKNRPYKKFIQTNDFYQLLDQETVYFSFIGNYETLYSLREKIKPIQGIGYTFYKDAYTPSYFLEIFSDHASKEHAASYLKEYVKADRLVSFGDNLNDLGMLRASDLSIAVSNGVEELKNVADLVLDNRDFTAVAKYVVENS